MDVCFIEEQTISDVEIVENWNSKISRKITCRLSVCDSELTLTNAVKDYLRVLEQQAIKFRMKDMLKEKVLNHVKIFYYCSTTLKAVAANMVHFWKDMDDILVILCNLELDCATLIRTYNLKGLTEVTLKLIYILSVFLLNDNQRICHVLLKLKAKANSEHWREVMKGVLRHFLLMIPIKDKSEESFCRNYLLFHSFKYALSEKNQNVMDAMLNNTFGMSPHSLTNFSLRKILLPSIESLQDFISDTSDSTEAAVRNYFTYMNGKRTDDDDHPMSLSIDLENDSEEDAVTIIPNAPDTVITIDDDVKTEDEVCLPTFNMHRLYQEVLTVSDESDVDDASVPTEIAHIPACDNVTTSFWDGIMITEEILIDTAETPVVEKLQSPHADLPSSPPDSFHKSYVEYFKCTEPVRNKVATKLNGDLTIAAKTIPDCSKLQTDKIVYTSSERVSASQSDFSKFELLQSELVRDTFSEPIGPICTFSNTDFEHSNSNDSVHSLHYTAALHENNLSTSPVPPPYEHIQAEDYHVTTHNDAYKSTKATSKLQIKKASKLISSDFQVHINSANRKRKSESVVHTPRKKVHFGPTEIRLIPPNEYD